MQLLDATTELRMAKHQIQQIAQGVEQGRQASEARSELVQAQIGHDPLIAHLRQYVGTLLCRTGERLRSGQPAAVVNNRAADRLVTR
jgi:hypothetical protein